MRFSPYETAVEGRLEVSLLKVSHVKLEEPHLKIMISFGNVHEAFRGDILGAVPPLMACGERIVDR